MSDDHVSVEEIADLLREIRELNDGTLPESDRERVMARKRALIEQIEPGYYAHWERHSIEVVAVEGGFRATCRVCEHWSTETYETELGAEEAAVFHHENGERLTGETPAIHEETER